VKNNINHVNIHRDFCGVYLLKKSEKENVFLDLRNKIMNLTYKPGTMLSEINLASEYNVSRSIIRDVLREIKDYGFIETIPRGGTYITEIAMKDFRDIFEVKSELEGLAAELVVERITLEQKNAFKKLVDKIQNGNSFKMSQEDYIEYDEKFHQLMRDASGNKELARLLENYHIRCTRLWYYISTDIPDDTFKEDYINFYEQGVVPQNTVRAKEIMRGHTAKFVNLIKIKIF
jgi:DNA-binding GntR family transcriptional regulator